MGLAFVFVEASERCQNLSMYTNPGSCAAGQDASATTYHVHLPMALDRLMDRRKMHRNSRQPKPAEPEPNRRQAFSSQQSGQSRLVRLSADP